MFSFFPFSSPKTEPGTQCCTPGFLFYTRIVYPEGLLTDIKFYSILCVLDFGIDVCTILNDVCNGIG